MSVLHLQLSAKKAKQVAQLMGNDTARRVMDAVADDSKSESQLAKELNIPLSTVHYNIQKLKDAGLVHSDEYTYSEKGKEVRHYKLASEHVIISTKPMTGLPPVIGGVTLSLALAFTFFWLRMQDAAPEESMALRAFDAAPEAAMLAPDTASAAAPAVWPWILIGAGTMLAGLLLVYLIQRYRA